MGTREHSCFGSSLYILLLFFQSLSHFWIYATPWTAAPQASLSFTISQSVLELMSIESVMPSKHLILCRPLLLLPPSFPVSESFPVSRPFPSGGPICLKLSLWKFSWRCKTNPQEASRESHMTVSSWQLGMEVASSGLSPCWGEWKLTWDLSGQQELH